MVVVVGEVVVVGVVVVVGGRLVVGGWVVLVVVGASVVEDLWVDGASVVVLSVVLEATDIVVAVVVLFGLVTTGPAIEMKFIIMDNVGAACSRTFGHVHLYKC